MARYRNWEKRNNYGYREEQGNRELAEIRVLNPSGGMNNQVAPNSIRDKEWVDLMNMEYIDGGSIHKRPGWKTVGAGLTNPASGLGILHASTGNILVTSDNGILKKKVGNDWVTLSTTVTMDPTKQIRFTSIRDKLYAWDGVSSGVIYDGTTVTRPGASPKAKISVYYKGYHVSTKVDGRSSRLYFAPDSDAGRNTWGADPSEAASINLHTSAEVPGATLFTGDFTPRAIDIAAADGDVVTGLGLFQDVLIVFKKHSIYQLTLDSDSSFVVERITSSYGCIAAGSVCPVENDLYFMGRGSVFVLGNEPNYYAAIRTNELSSRVKPIFERVMPSGWEKVSSLYFRDRYFISLPVGGDVVNYLLTYDRRFYAWLPWGNIYANAMIIYEDSSDIEHFYFNNNQLPSMCEFTWGIYSDNGNPIEAWGLTKAFDANSFDRSKIWEAFRLLIKDGTSSIDITLLTEYDTYEIPSFIIDTITGGLGFDMPGELTLGLSGSSSAIVTPSGSSPASFPQAYEFGARVESRLFQMKFYNNNNNEDFIITGWAILYEMLSQDTFSGEFTYMV